jgi:hypothetical protein
MDRRCRTREIIDFVDLDVERKCHIVSDKLEALVADQMFDVSPRARVEVVDTDDVCTPVQEALAKVGAQKARATGDQYPLL